MKKFIIFLILVTLFTPYTLYSQWYKQQIPVNKPISGIKFTDTLNGWAVTYNYTETNQDTSYILHTTNGGTNWFIQLMKIPFDFDALFMVDSLVGYVSLDSIGGVPPFTTAWPRLYKTTNGGINWNDIPLMPNMAISNMQFLNRDTGWEFQFASGPDIRLTTDGGLTWQVRVNGILSGITTLFFLNYNTGFCGAQLYLYKTTNAGMNWNFLNSFSDGINSIFFLNENSGWVCLNINEKLYFTSNGGNNWVLQYYVPSSAHAFYNIFFFDNQVGFAGWSGQKIFKTTNGGNYWGFQIDTGGSVYSTFTDSLHGWTEGIYHTSNGGGTIISVKKISNFVPSSFELFQNYPNPFNSQTTIQFSIKQSSHVTFKIYNIEGRELTPWIFGWEQDKLLKPGKYEIQFDGKDMASGTYFFRLIVTDANSKSLFSKTIKMILIK